MQMKLNAKKLTALFLAVLMVVAALTLPASAVWGEFTSHSWKDAKDDKPNVSLRQGKSKEVWFKFKGDGIDHLDVSTMGYDEYDNPAGVVNASFVETKMKWKAAGKTCKGVVKLKGLQKGNAIVTIKMRNDNGEYLGDASIITFSVRVS